MKFFTYKNLKIIFIINFFFFSFIFFKKSTKAVQPTITLTGVDVIYTEDGGPVPIASGVTIIDSDGTLNSALVELHYRQNGTSEVLNANITGTSITKNFDASDGILYLTGPDTPSNFQQVIESITYDNESNEPDDSQDRIVSIEVLDNTSSDSDTVNVEIIEVNDPPKIQLNGEEDTQFYVDGYPVLVDLDLTVSDVDDTELEGATITLVNHPDQLEESIAVDVSGTDIEVDYDSSGFILTLDGTDSLSNYQKVLRSLTYDNQDIAPNVEDRHITIKVDDGQAESTLVNIAIDIRTNSTLADIDILNSGIYEVDTVEVEMQDEDSDTHGEEQDEIEIYAENQRTGEREYFWVIETEDSSAIFEGAFRTTNDETYNLDDDDYLYVLADDVVVVTYEDSQGTATDQKTVYAGEREQEQDPDYTEEIFPDIVDHTLKEYIINLYNDGIVNGYSDGTFKPENPVTRGEMASFIVRAFELDVEITRYCFKDLPVDHTHRDNILILCNLDIISGYSDETYKPDIPVDRDQVTKFIAMAMKKQGMNIDWSVYSVSYTDLDESNKFYKYIAFLSNAYYGEETIIKGFSDGTFRPKDEATRSQMAKIIDLGRKYFQDNF